MTHEDSKQAPSRLDRHYALLGLGEPLPETALASERRVMEETQPLPLDFGRAARRELDAASTATPLSERLPAGAGRVPPRRYWGAAAALLAALLAIVVYVRRHGEPALYQTMGGGAGLKVFYQQDQAVEAWTKDTVLKPGARVKVEVHASDEPTTAFWGVTAGAGPLLTDQAWIWGSKLEVEAGQTRGFPDSVELEGASQNETLVVLTCPTASLSAPTPEAVTAAIGAAPSAPLPAGLERCQRTRFTLRP